MKNEKDIERPAVGIDFVNPIEDKMRGIIKVVGVGGGGCNAVRNMWEEKVDGVTYAVCNTDSQSLSRSPVPMKVQLGAGLGAGGNPELGRTEAESCITELQQLLSDGTKMVFVTAGMGGGTGTGAAPVVASVAREMGMLTVGVVTIPFFFEKNRKIVKALKGVEQLRQNVDALLIVNNERLCDVYADSKIPMKEAFRRADSILMDAVKGIAELITLPSDGGIKSDFRDVEATLKNGGGAIMAMGRASGENRVQQAIMNALDSPLIYGNDIGKAKRILFNIYASDEHPIFVNEMLQIDDFFDQLDPNIDVIWGTATDDTLGEDAKVTILATGLEDDLRSDADGVEHNDSYYEALIPKLYKPMKRVTVTEVVTKDQPTFEVEAAKEPETADKVQFDSPLGERRSDPLGDSHEADSLDRVGDSPRVIRSASHAGDSPLDSPLEPEEPEEPEESSALVRLRQWLSGMMKAVTE